MNDADERLVYRDPADLWAALGRMVYWAGLAENAARLYAGALMGLGEEESLNATNRLPWPRLGALVRVLTTAFWGDLAPNEIEMFDRIRLAVEERNRIVHGWWYGEQRPPRTDPTIPLFVLGHMRNNGQIALEGWVPEDISATADEFFVGVLFFNALKDAVLAERAEPGRGQEERAGIGTLATEKAIAFGRARGWPPPTEEQGTRSEKD